MLANGLSGRGVKVIEFFATDPQPGSKLSTQIGPAVDQFDGHICAIISEPTTGGVAFPVPTRFFAGRRVEFLGGMTH